ncbi:MAG: hypothetical protein ACYSQY_10950 [Planctomycetota bacterium]
MKLSTNLFNAILHPFTSNSALKLDSCFDSHSIDFTLSFQNLIIPFDFIMKASSLSAVRRLFKTAEVDCIRTAINNKKYDNPNEDVFILIDFPIITFIAYKASGTPTNQLRGRAVMKKPIFANSKPQ